MATGPRRCPECFGPIKDPSRRRRHFYFAVASNIYKRNENAANIVARFIETILPGYNVLRGTVYVEERCLRMPRFGNKPGRHILNRQENRIAISNLKNSNRDDHEETNELLVTPIGLGR